MTAIAGLIDGKNVWIGGDSAAGRGQDVRVRSDAKVFRLHNGMLVGCTTSFRMAQLIRYKFTAPEQSASKDDMRYLVTDFVDELRHVFRSNGLMEVNNSVESGGEFLIGWKGGLYSIMSDFQVADYRLDGIAAAGCGESYVIGSLASTTGDPERRVRTALEVAAGFSEAVRPPFTILNDKTAGAKKK